MPHKSTTMENSSNNQTEGSLPVARVVENRAVHLVVIEDDKFLRDLIVRKLTKEGFVVTEAPDGEAGLKAMREHLPQLVLLDILLPGMSGFDVLEAVHKDEKISSIPVVVLSNLGQQEDIERAHSLGAKDFLIKAKHTPGEIVTRVKEILHELYM